LSPAEGGHPYGYPALKWAYIVGNSLNGSLEVILVESLGHIALFAQMELKGMVGLHVELIVVNVSYILPVAYLQQVAISLQLFPESGHISKRHLIFTGLKSPYPDKDGSYLAKVGLYQNTMATTKVTTIEVRGPVNGP